ncbi:SpoIVB peptidase [Clostridium sp. 'White wine YQ']|uniref:SpoIVB peptidase n=1 Tax=Clostridium sp. 'White wine YQ' TaxID=3027474 RepID=UPI00236645DB|nr:SpoIVB peptidase [Clostridium sp. 'White wine YQ']MDD7793927.1 SpoIVB peptidase [Clostridium sp. 'White wine YQ']
MKNQKKSLKNLVFAPLILLLMVNLNIGSGIDKSLFSSSNGNSQMAFLPTDAGINNKLTSSLNSLTVNKVSLKDSDKIQVYPGGVPVGIKLSSKGVLVVGYSDIQIEENKVVSPAKEEGIEIGDVILRINNEEVEDSQDLIRKVSNSRDDKLDFEISKSGKKINKQITRVKSSVDNKYKIGLWVRDSTAGVGTLTFYDKKTNKYGALGHAIIDGDTNSIIEIKSGSLLKSSIINLRKSEKGAPGELRGIFVEENEPLGTINQNTYCGIFGELKENNQYINNKPMKIALRNEIKEGKAQILTTIDENGPQLYDIEISKLLVQDKPGPKSMIIKVTDTRLLSKTGGIVQGMSGSPIIQNGKLIGAVTHVLINNPEVGYGIYIEWMLQDSNILK